MFMMFRSSIPRTLYRRYGFNGLAVTKPPVKCVAINRTIVLRDGFVVDDAWLQRLRRITRATSQHANGARFIFFGNSFDYPVRYAW